ncbi:CBS domain-containing protein [Euryhalocaulis caribicus]|uniref:CBS domain-containing protein n=1 Tax=Euryhalocaulis caribicus TaxID=1161401 RepID=UPI0003A6A2CE|nr:CBS domain-containing protein [Euryhalocaulis caribicus]
MTAASILKDKGGEVFTISQEASLAEAAQLLDEKRIGAVIIVGESGGPVGVFSERDLARQIARAGAEALNVRVGECMTRDVVFCGPGDSVDGMMGMMTDRRIRHLPVVENGKLIGVISIGDVVKRKIAEAEAEARAMKDYIATG